MSDYKQTLGEYRVGVSFNPSNNPLVDEIKRKAADLMDLIMTLPTPPTGGYRAVEIHRSRTKAYDCIEEAAMWAVKAATKPERE
jgi:hypothetical protein